MENCILLRKVSVGCVLFPIVLMGAFSGALGEPVSPEQLQGDINSYFQDIKTTFDRIADAPAVKRTSLSKTDRYFVSALRQHQAIFTLIKTNSQGVVISEVIRGQKPERNFRNISTQQWYSKVERTHKDYQGFLKEDNGRYYLFWSKPVLKGGNQRFVGSVVAKIDLWDCFHAFANDVTEPFLIRMHGISLYSNKWKNGNEYRELDLDVPGVDRISVRSTEAASAPGPVEVAAPVTAPVVQPPLVPAESSQRAVTLRSLLRNKTFVVIAIVTVLIILVFAVRLMVQINHWRLMRKVDRSDIL